MRNLIIALLVFISFGLNAQTYHKVENGNIVQSGLPTSYTSDSGVYWFKNYRNAPDSIKYVDGWRIEVTPDYDSETQRLGSLYFDVENDNVTRTVITKSQVELDAEKEAILRSIENQFDVEKIKHILQLLVEPIIDSIEVDSANINALTTIYNQWRVGIEYEAGDKVVSDSTLYKVIQPHTSQSDWKPEVAVSLFVKFQPDTNEVLEWDYPVQYYNGTGEEPQSIVLYNDIEYRCIQSHTSQAGWNPVAVQSLWELNN